MGRSKKPLKQHFKQELGTKPNKNHTVIVPNAKKLLSVSNLRSTDFDALLIDVKNNNKNINEGLLKWEKNDAIDAIENNRLLNHISVDMIVSSMESSPFASHLQIQPDQLYIDNRSSLGGAVMIPQHVNSVSGTDELSENTETVLNFMKILDMSVEKAEISEAKFFSTDDHYLKKSTTTTAIDMIGQSFLSPSSTRRSSGRSEKKNYLDMLLKPNILGSSNDNHIPQRRRCIKRAKSPKGKVTKEKEVSVANFNGSISKKECKKKIENIDTHIQSICQNPVEEEKELKTPKKSTPCHQYCEEDSACLDLQVSCAAQKTNADLMCTCGPHFMNDNATDACDKCLQPRETDSIVPEPQSPLQSSQCDTAKGGGDGSPNKTVTKRRKYRRDRLDTNDKWSIPDSNIRQKRVVKPTQFNDYFVGDANITQVLSRRKSSVVHKHATPTMVAPKKNNQEQVTIDSEIRQDVLYNEDDHEHEVLDLGDHGAEPEDAPAKTGAVDEPRQVASSSYLSESSRVDEQRKPEDEADSAMTETHVVRRCRMKNAIMEDASSHVVRPGGPRVKQVSRQSDVSHTKCVIKSVHRDTKGSPRNDAITLSTESGLEENPLLDGTSEQLSGVVICRRTRVCGQCDPCLLNNAQNDEAETCTGLSHDSGGEDSQMVPGTEIIEPPEVREMMAETPCFEDVASRDVSPPCVLTRTRHISREVDVYRDSDEEDHVSEEENIDPDADCINTIKADEVLTSALANVGGYPIVTSRCAMPNKVLCYSCGSGGEQMIHCVSCAESFHFFCIEFQFRPKSKEMFVCRNCTKCHLCKQYGSDLKCIKCLIGFHPACVEKYPPSRSEDRSKWACYKCAMCLHCGVRAEDAMNKSGRDTREIDWDKDPWQCGRCARARKEGHVCPECGRAYQEGQETVECSKCTKSVHRQCAGITEDHYEIMRSHGPSSLELKATYDCSRCQSVLDKDHPRLRASHNRQHRDSKLKQYCEAQVLERISDFICRSGAKEDQMMQDHNLPEILSIGGESALQDQIDGANDSDDMDSVTSGLQTGSTEYGCCVPDSPTIERDHCAVLCSSWDWLMGSGEETVSVDEEVIHDHRTMEEVKEDPRTMVEVKEDPRTMVEVKEVPRTMVEVKDDPMTIVEVKDDPRTIVEVKDDTRTMEEVKDDPRTIVEVKDDTRTMEEVKDDPRTIVEVKDDPMTVVEVKDDPRTMEKVKDDPRTIVEVKEDSIIMIEDDDTEVLRPAAKGGIFNIQVTSDFLTPRHMIMDSLARINTKLCYLPKNSRTMQAYSGLLVLLKQLCVDLFPWIDFDQCLETVHDVARTSAGRAEIMLTTVAGIIREGLQRELDVFSCSVWDIEDKLHQSLVRGREDFIVFHSKQHLSVLMEALERQPLDDGHHSRYVRAFPTSDRDGRLICDRDVRRCVLCGSSGDDGLGGRLIYGSQDVWVHVNCALWSDEVYEEEDGALVNVEDAIRRGRGTACACCKKYGATVRCSADSSLEDESGRCRNCYHFTCAFDLSSDRVFTESRAFFCSQRHSQSRAEKHLGPADMLILRRIYMRPSNRTKKDPSCGLAAADVVVTIGNLRIDSLGTLRVHSDSSKTHLCPVEYRARRLFWSMDTLDSLVMYDMCIKDEPNVVKSAKTPLVVPRAPVVANHPPCAAKGRRLIETIDSRVAKRARPAECDQVVYEMDESGNLKLLCGPSEGVGTPQASSASRPPLEAPQSHRVNRRFPKDTKVKRSAVTADVSVVNRPLPSAVEARPRPQPHMVPRPATALISHPCGRTVPPPALITTNLLQQGDTLNHLLRSVPQIERRFHVVRNGSKVDLVWSRPPSVIKLPPNKVLTTHLMRDPFKETRLSAINPGSHTLFRQVPSRVGVTSILKTVLTMNSQTQPRSNYVISASGSIPKGPSSSRVPQFDGEADECSIMDGSISSQGSDSEAAPSSTGRTKYRASEYGRLLKYTIEGFKSSRSPMSAWTYLVRRVSQMRAGQGLAEYPLRTGDGWAKFGIDHRWVVNLVEQMVGALHCRQYHFKYHMSTICQQRQQYQPQMSAVSLGSRSSQWFNEQPGHVIRDPLAFLGCKSNRAPRNQAPLEPDLSDDPRPDEFYLQNLASQFHDLSCGVEAREKNVLVCVSVIHGRGLFARREYAAHDIIIEYVGETIRSVLSDVREVRYQKSGVDCYMFRLDRDTIVDATCKGNAARFINHSCQPNCYAKVVKFVGEKHIVIIAERRIYKGEELTYDYRFPSEEDKLVCTCGSAHCRKYLN